MSRRYPEETAGPCVRPPHTFEDRDGRSVTLETDGAYREDLVEMYREFRAVDRAQGIPPSSEAGIRSWLDDVLATENVNVVALTDERVVGHAMLVRDDDGSAELAIFVHEDYQNAGIGTQLMQGLLGAGVEAGLDRIWLTVEERNEAAIALYEKMGFVRTANDGFVLEMAASLDPDAID